jgi:hypothetical protein
MSSLEKKVHSTGAMNRANSKSAQQSERHGPGHGTEQAAFHALQGEDGQVRNDDDDAREENRLLHFVGRGRDDLSERFLPRPSSVWRMMFSTITTEPSTTMPKSSAPSDSRFAGM